MRNFPQVYTLPTPPRAQSAASTAGIVSATLWIYDEEVHQIFGRHRCYYTSSNGFRRQEADGVFLRYQRSKEGTLGYVFRNPLNGENWLWVISKKNRKPFAIGRVS
ncbi:hypothetical protein CO671_01800 [Rhizobium sp. M10]|uniref:hypothetical protein n=1 Tax=Rhizobium sp. M10 TaxID=1324586 RepID=UPI000BE8C4C8|nr:hypothetical protein [Rhizobium sp. M10]PDT38156.1 hypothetical protein CO671_01800 [Rhizobium sp. M10]